MTAPFLAAAEEETKAEEHRSVIHSNRTIKTVGEALSYAETALLKTYPESAQRAHYAEVIAELLRDVARQRPVGSNGKHGELHTPTCGCEDVSASSPVVPAPTETGPTETGPWPTWDDVPSGIKYRESPRRGWGTWWWINRNGIRRLADFCGEEVATTIAIPVGPFEAVYQS